MGKGKPPEPVPLTYAEVKAKKAADEAQKGKKKKKKKKPRRRKDVPDPDVDPLNPSADYRRGWNAVRALQAAIGRRYLSVAQVTTLVTALPRCQWLRVEAICALFSRVVDLDRFYELFASLTEAEGDELTFRLGYLNCCSAVNAECGGRRYKLNLRTPDEHGCATVLVQLAILEPGENWVDERYKLKETAAWAPGWELPWGWETEVIHFGTLETRYTDRGAGCVSGGDNEARRRLQGHFLCGCRPDDSAG
jgi:hypothetical protein